MTTRISQLALFAALLVGSCGLNAQPRTSQGFSDASLTGSFGVREQGDGSVAAGLGIVRYDGAGKSTRILTVNAPGEDGGRRILVFESEGVYHVNRNGTGVATYTNQISNGETTTDTFDFVITETVVTWVPSRGQTRVAAELFAAQREAGVTVSLVTSLQKRIAD